MTGSHLVFCGPVKRQGVLYGWSICGYPLDVGDGDIPVHVLLRKGFNPQFGTLRFEAAMFCRERWGKSCCDIEVRLLLSHSRDIGEGLTKDKQPESLSSDRQTFEIIRSWGPKSLPEGSKWRSRGVKMKVPEGSLGFQGEVQILGEKQEVSRERCRMVF